MAARIDEDTFSVDGTFTVEGRKTGKGRTWRHSGVAADDTQMRIVDGKLRHLPPVTTTTGGPLAADDFNRSDRDLNGDNGWVYSKHPDGVGAAKIQTNVASLQGFAPLVVRDLGVTEYEFSIFSPSNGGNAQAVAWRFVDRGNYFYVEGFSGRVWRIVNGTATAIGFLSGMGGGAEIAWGVNTTIRVRVKGNVHTIFTNDTQRFQFTDSALSTATRVGFGHNSASATVPWDNFKASSDTVTTVTGSTRETAMWVDIPELAGITFTLKARVYFDKVHAPNVNDLTRSFGLLACGRTWEDSVLAEHYPHRDIYDIDTKKKFRSANTQYLLRLPGNPVPRGEFLSPALDDNAIFFEHAVLPAVESNGTYEYALTVSGDRTTFYASMTSPSGRVWVDSDGPFVLDRSLGGSFAAAADYVAAHPNEVGLYFYTSAESNHPNQFMGVDEWWVEAGTGVGVGDDRGKQVHFTQVRT